MINRRLLKKLAEQHGTPLFVVDHDQLRRNYAQFKRYLPRVQAYYAVKANSDPAIVKTFYEAGGSFDVASMPEFRIVYEYIKDLPDKKRQDWIWDKIIYANPIKANETLQDLNQYKPLVTYDNYEEIKKIKKHAPLAGLALRIKVPNTGAMVELSSKFGAAPGEAVDLILAADKAGLVVEGLSFHVGSQTTNFQNYVAALNLAANLFKEAKDRGYTKMNLLDIGGGFPAPYDDSVKPFRELATTHQPRARPPLPEEHPDPRRAGPVHGRHRRRRRLQDHRQGRARREALLLHQRRRLSHLLRRHLRPLHLPPQGLQARADANLLRVRPHLRRARRGLHGRATARRPQTGRPALQREHRRLQPRLLDLVQRLRPGQGGPREPMIRSMGGRCWRRVIATFCLAPLLAVAGPTNSWRVFRSLSSGAALGTNTVVNPGMETAGSSQPLAIWNAYGSGYTASTTTAHGGARSLQCTAATGTEVHGGYQTIC